MTGIRTWQQAWVDHLSALIDEGLSAKAIAELLSKEYRREFTRNGVIGKAHRLGKPCKSVWVPRPQPRHKRVPRRKLAVPVPRPEPPPPPPEHPGIPLLE